MEYYNYKERDKFWQQQWEKEQVYQADESSGKPKYYVLDMFPYPSGAGLHVGHPLGYIASDIYTRYKRHQGFEVLHPMGFDAFGLPAEQYAIETGEHPAKVTERNLQRYREQLKNIGLSFDWSREVKTCDPDFYKWTQWIFLQLFDSWYDKKADKAKPVSDLVKFFAEVGNDGVEAQTSFEKKFTKEDWQNWSEEEQQRVLLNYRLAYIAESEVNWCPALGTVLANEEVKDGLSERGGHPVVKKKMRQWFLRITAYAERLLQGLEEIDWPEPLKEMQRNWIGKSVGAQVFFHVHEDYQKGGPEDKKDYIEVFTTRPDTIFGATFMVIAPEHPLLKKLTTDEHREEVEQYLEQTQRKTERDRMTNVKEVSGVFTGSYVDHPFTQHKLPIWVADYVLGDYGTGAIMAVPAHDSRDFAFAKKFDLPIVQVVREKGKKDQETNPLEDSYDAKDGVLINSDFLNDLEVPAAIEKAVEEIEKHELGKGAINYRLRDANFSRQRYWGEPFPIVYNGDIPYAVDEKDLPVTLPDVESYKPLGTGESPLAAVEDWVNLPDGRKRETNTMPGWAGSSWYFLRYMDPHNSAEFVSKEQEQYWQNVDFYIGGAEHATSHLLYSRFWHKFLYDRGLISTREPFKKLINQGMIQGRSSIVYRVMGTNKFVSVGLKKEYETTPLHVDVSLVKNDILDTEKFTNWREEYADAEFILEDGKYICGHDIEKMSKRWFNVVNPDDVVAEYGADVFRMYEMFLGPIEQSKPWSTEGIDGVFRFVRKFWRLFYDDKGNLIVTDEEASAEELKSLHKAIKKVTEDMENISFNTSVSAFMICTNELGQQNCHKRSILEPLVSIIAPFAPHVAEELWQALGNSGSVAFAKWPEYNEDYLKEDTKEYPVSINGKPRATIKLPVDITEEEAKEQVLQLGQVQKYTEGKPIRRFILVPGRIINIVV